MRKVLLFTFFIGLFFAAQAQYLRIGDANFLGTAGGPIVTNANPANYNSRFAYIFPRAVLGNMMHGDTLTSIEFSRLSGTGLNSSCNIKIYIKNTTLTDFGSGNLYWPGQLSGTTLVYNQSPNGHIGTSEGFHKLPFNNSKYFFDTTNGHNLEILVEYTQTASQPGRINFYFENSSTVNGYAANQTKYSVGATLNDTLRNSNDYHPTIIFNYPRQDNDIAILKVYTLGKLPVPLGNPDSTKALVRNVGKKTQSSAQLQSWSIGPNKQLDSATFSIAAGEQKFVNLPSLNPSKKGLDTVFARISSDNNKTNDTSLSYRLANENIYSYRDVTQAPAPGGIGFDGFTGDFVARFFSSKVKAINQVTVSFAITGRPFRIGIWDNSKNNNQPAKLIYLSDSLISTAGSYILNLKKPVSVDGTFFVGVRQLGTDNIAFGYQIEDPIRPNTFYYTSPANDTNWFDFFPDAPYKFIIEPRMQGDTDLAAISADYPKDTLDRRSFTTLAPKGTISNLGVKDLLDSFSVTAEIRFFGKLVYKETIRDTLSSGRSRSYTFPNTFDPKDFGEHELLIYTKAQNDQILDNDTVRRKFYIGIKNDVMVATVFEPSENSNFEYLRDTILPVATIQNPSYNGTSNFVARCRILKGNTVIYNRTQTLNLPKFNSKILIWPVYKCTDTGKLTFIFTVEMGTDVYRLNDTQVRNVWVNKSYDIIIDSSVVPDKTKIYTPNVNYYPVVRATNDGLLDATDVTVVCRITSPYTTYTYNDTIKVNVDGKKHFYMQFAKAFKPPVKGRYSLFARSFFDEDLVKFNDSFRIFFNVGAPYDYLTKQVLYPLSTDTLAVGSGLHAPKVKIKNDGYVKNTDLVPIICQIWRNNIRLYQDIKTMNLDTGASFDLEFAKTFNPINAGEHTLLVYTNYGSDVNRKNDTVLGKFWVKVGRDASVRSIDTPGNTAHYEARSSNIPIKATIGNAGSLKIAAVRTYAEIWRHGKMVYFDKADDSLDAFGSRIINFSKVFVANDSGMHHLIVYTYSAQDQNIFNDTTALDFMVYKSKDATISKWLEPVPGSVIMHNSGNRKPGVTVVQKGTDTGAVLSGKVYFTIVALPSSTVYRDSASFTGLKIGTPVDVVSPNDWGFDIMGTYLATAIVKAGELFPENDTLEAPFEIQTNGISKPAKVHIYLFPNPAAKEIHVISSLPLQNVWAANMAGASVQLAKTGEGTWDVSGLASGVYVLHADTRDGGISIRFVRE